MFLEWKIGDTDSEILGLFNVYVTKTIIYIHTLAFSKRYSIMYLEPFTIVFLAPNRVPGSQNVFVE